jgi:hypothetical protein
MRHLWLSTAASVPPYAGAEAASEEVARPPTPSPCQDRAAPNAARPVPGLARQGNPKPGPSQKGTPRQPTGPVARSGLSGLS